jgi:hypothetical protein
MECFGKDTFSCYLFSAVINHQAAFEVSWILHKHLFQKVIQICEKGSYFSQSLNPEAESPTCMVSVVPYSVQRYRYLFNLEFESVLCFGFLTDFTTDIASLVQPWCGETFFFK